MSTFSSVARKPGPALKPRAAPRRNVPRHAQKPAVAATLTPESLPASPEVRSTSPARLDSETNTPQDLTSEPVEQEPNAGLTPPATGLEPLSPPPQPSNENVVTASSAPAPSTEGDASLAQGDEVPAVVASESPARAGSKRRAEEASLDVDDATTTSSQTQPPANSRSKRRKAAPQGGASYLLSRPTEPASRAQTETPGERRSASVAEDRVRASTEDLLQQATASFGSVSRIAGSIETRTRSLRPRSARAAGTAAYAEADNEDEGPPRRRTGRSSRSTAIADLAEAVINDAIGYGRRRGRKAATPEDAETHEIDVNEVSMKDLTKDTGLGKRSATGRELDSNWAEISRRWKEGPEENRRKAQAKTQEEKDARKAKEKAAAAAAQVGEQLVGVHVRTEIVNGLIVTVDGAREIEYSQNLPAAVESGAITARDVRKVDNYINSNRVGKNAGLRTQKRWDDESDELFYKGLRMFGTDFEMIASLFSTRRRAEIKAKYTREERENWEKVKRNLERREHWTTESVAEMTGRSEPWESPEELAAELKREEERMKREAKEKDIAEGLIANPDADGDDVPIQSIEGVEPVEDGAAPERSGRVNRFDALAEEVVSAAGRPASTRTPVQTRKRVPRRTRDATTTKTAKGKKGKQTLAGVEEVVGSVRDMQQP